MPRMAGAIALLLALLTLSEAQRLKIEKYTLPNGMKVILHEDHSLPVATVNIWYYVGSKDEPPRRSGFAHLFEHLMFMGTERVPGSQFDQIMEKGGGFNNATTTADRTNYYSYGPSSLLPTLLWLDADRLEDFGRMMDQKKLDLQREVVKNERRENTENTPYGKVSLALFRTMYPEGHPYQIETIGLPEDLDAASVGDVKDFFATYYVPNNASLVVAGDFDPKEIKPLIDRLFGTLPRADEPIHRTAAKAQLQEVKRLTLVDRVPQARTYIAWHSPAYYKPGDAEMDLAGSVLSGGFASRLYQRLVVKDGICSDVAAYQQSQFLGSLFMVVATAKDGVPLDRVEAAIDQELERFKREGPTAEELARQKAGIEMRAVAALQSLEDRADRLNEFEFYRGEPDSFDWNLQRYRKATGQDVRKWAREVLDPNARLILRVLPESPKIEQNPRNEQPAASADRPFELPKPEELTLANGLRVFYWHRPELPLMSMSTLFLGGAASDDASKSGLAAATAGLLDQGAGNLDAEAFSRRMELLGASFSAGAGQTASSAALTVLAVNFEPALSLYADALMRPRLDPADWERNRGLLLDQFAQDAEDPGTVARIVGQREFFGAGHPFGRRVTGTPETVKSIQISDIRREHPLLFRPDIATVFLAGNLPSAQVKASLERTLGTWKVPAQAPAGRPLLSSPLDSPLRVVVVDRPGAVQTVIRFLLPGRPYSDPARLTLQGLGTVLGGSFTSRLNANLREEKGYTYGAGAGFAFEREFGWLTASAAVRADVSGASLREFLKEFQKIRTGDVSEDEALKARSSLRTEVIGSMSTLGGLVGAAQGQFLMGRTLADLGSDLAAISHLDRAAINAAAKEAIRQDRGVLVLVGDRQTILKQLEGLGLPVPETVRGIQ